MPDSWDASFLIDKVAQESGFPAAHDTGSEHTALMREAEYAIVADDNYNFNDLVETGRRQSPKWDMVDCQYWGRDPGFPEPGDILHGCRVVVGVADGRGGRPPSGRRLCAVHPGQYSSATRCRRVPVGGPLTIKLEREEAMARAVHHEIADHRGVSGELQRDDTAASFVGARCGDRDRGDGRSLPGTEALRARPSPSRRRDRSLPRPADASGWRHRAPRCPPGHAPWRPTSGP
mgnify:CR=1 FL=1